MSLIDEKKTTILCKQQSKKSNGEPARCSFRFFNTTIAKLIYFYRFVVVVVVIIHLLAL